MSSRIEPNLLKKLNERRVIETIQSHGPASRADVTRIAGMSPPTVSKAVASLIEAGLLEEVESQQPTFGRPGRLLRLASGGVCVIGVVIDVRYCWLGSAGLDGAVDWDNSLEFPTSRTYDGLIRAIAERATRLIDDGGAAFGLALSVPGLVNRRRQETIFSPNLHLTDGRSPAQDLSEKLGIKCVVFQESHALCLGERFYGSAKDLDDFAILDVGTGLGLGVMSGGRLLEGHSGLAGELGHITVERPGKPCGCGNSGCLETVATDTAFAQAVSEELGRSVDIDEAIRLIQSGEFTPAESLERIRDYLSVALAAVVNIFNPATLFVHGQVFDVSDDLFSQVVEMTRTRALGPSFDDCRFERARVDKKQAAVASILFHVTNSLAPALG